MLLALAAACALAFGALAVVARSTAYLPFDPPVSHAIQAQDTAWLRALAEAVSWIGFPPQVDVEVALLAVAIFLTGRRWEAAGVAIAGAGAGALYLAVLPLVDQPRPSPDLVRVATSLTSSAFPSGHITTFTAVLGFIGYVVSRLGRLAARVAVVSVAVFLIVMAWARLYQGEHWLSELLGGLCLGGFWLAVTIGLYRRRRELSARAR
jgi:membrane-associated phospholipid phosphatase